MKLVPVSKHFRLREIFPAANFWIDIDPENKTVNIPATGPLSIQNAEILIDAIKHAISTAKGQAPHLKDDGITIAKCSYDIDCDGCDGSVGAWCGYCRVYCQEENA